MKEILNKDALGLVGIEDVVALYEKLTPWDQSEVSELIGTDFDTYSEQEIIEYFGINPIHFVDAGDVRDAFGTEVFEDYCDYEILDEVEERLWRIKPDKIIDLLDRKAEERSRAYWFTDDDIERLEDILALIKEKKNT